MKSIDIANQFQRHETQISHIKQGRRFTDDLALAQAIAAKTGKAPIAYIKKNLRLLVLAAHPEFSKKVTVHGQKITKTT